MSDWTPGPRAPEPPKRHEMTPFMKLLSTEGGGFTRIEGEAGSELHRIPYVLDWYAGPSFALFGELADDEAVRVEAAKLLDAVQGLSEAVYDAARQKEESDRRRSQMREVTVPVPERKALRYDGGCEVTVHLETYQALAEYRTELATLGYVVGPWKGKECPWFTATRVLTDDGERDPEEVELSVFGPSFDETKPDVERLVREGAARESGERAAVREEVAERQAEDTGVGMDEPVGA